MKKKNLSMICVFLFTPIVIVALVYIGLSVYYSDTFVYGVFVNDFYATGRSPEELNEELIAKTQVKDFVIEDGFGNEEVISKSSIGLTYSFLPELEKIQKKQNPLYWYATIGEYGNYKINPTGTFNESELNEQLDQLGITATISDIDSIPFEIIKGEKGYELLDGTKSVIDHEKAATAISNALKEGKSSINLLDSECYQSLAYTEEMKETFSLWKKIAYFQNCEITYLFGESKEVLDAAVVCNWIKMDENNQFEFDEDGNLILNEEKIKEYVEYLSNTYDTVNKERRLMATRGEMVTIPAGTYGNKIDKKAEIEYLTNAFLNKKTEEHTPAYSQKAWKEGLDDIGDTYIEVDLTNQMLYYHLDGTIVLETPVVTGNISRKNGTPEKACYVYYKQTNRILRGEDYATPVKYWIAVYNRIGIHDATWRSKFGGTIYKKAGSHGCINTPSDKVSALYDMVEIGTPVMIFY